VYEKHDVTKKQINMKKKILMLGLSLGAACMVLIQCKKNPEESTSSIKPIRNIQPNYAKAECKVPPGYTSCNADCKFADCCVVWNPAVETGGCECMLGFSFCKTEPIPKPKAGETAVSTAVRTIWVNTTEVTQFFSYCNANGIETAALQEQFDIIRTTALANEGNRVKAQPAAYDIFIEKLKAFFKQLSVDKQTILKDYAGA
jgi:hypothetical protein